MTEKDKAAIRDVILRWIETDAGFFGVGFTSVERFVNMIAVCLSTTSVEPRRVQGVSRNIVILPSDTKLAEDVASMCQDYIPESALRENEFRIAEYREQIEAAATARLSAPEKETLPTDMKKFQEGILNAAKEGKVCFFGMENEIYEAPIDEFIKQPVEGILYDLNRLPEVVMTFWNDRKWVNDYAMQLVLRRLHELAQQAILGEVPSD